MGKCKAQLGQQQMGCYNQRNQQQSKAEMLGIGDGHHVLPCTRQGQEEFQNVGHESRLNENISECARMVDLRF